MNKGIYIIGLVLAILLLVGNASACTVSMTDFDLEIRSDTEGYGDNVDAVNGDDVDIRVELTIGTVADSSYACGSNAQVIADIYTYNGSSYEYWVSTSTQNVNLTNGQNATITWDDAFEVDDSYSRYQVRAKIYDANTDFSTQTSTIYVEQGECSDIILRTEDFNIDAGEEQTQTFEIENNSNVDFEVTSIDLSINNTDFSINSITYNDTVGADDSEDVDIEIEADSDATDQEIDGTFRVSGNLGALYCSVSDIGSETFTVEIDGDADNDDSDDTSPADCDELSITANDFTIREGEEETVSFYLTNDSTKRFEILDVETSDNGVDIQTHFFEQYAFSGEVADIVLSVDAPNVSSNKVYENYIQVRGIFSDGTECQLEDVEDETFDVSVTNTIGFSSATCGELTIEVPDRVSVQNYGTIPFTIVNGTEKRADIIFESTIDVNPTLISLPENTSISREISVTIVGSEATILVKPQVDGCNYSSQKIIVENTARGNLEDVTMSLTMEEGDDGIKMIVEFDNPTNKAFQGELSFEMPEGWNAENRIITAAPGKTIAEVQLSHVDGAAAGKGTARFVSGGEELTQEFGTSDRGAFTAGLFALGDGMILGLIMIAVLVLVVLLVMQADTVKTADEEVELMKWETDA